MTDGQEEQQFGFTEEELDTHPTAYRDDLFRGKVVLVSGAGSGMGKATAWLFARLGARVVLCGRTLEKLERTAAGLERLGADALVHPMNIRDPEQVDGLDAVWERFGGLDVLINNAGGQFAQDAIDFSPNGWKAVIDNNLNGTWYMMQNAAQRWRDGKKPGAIVNVTSSIWRGVFGVAHSCAARAGVIYLSKTVAVEWAPFNIRVNNIAPGTHETEGFANYTPEARAQFKQSNPMLHNGDAWDIAEACVYLAAPSGKFITGETLTIDGGGQMWGEMWINGKPDYFKLEG
ncbi:MAG TPA: SDR family oxidoreductase [Sneathiellales bacterium]|nr:SDR family oxidoreductase [Sneathiellales bacterium]